MTCRSSKDQSTNSHYDTARITLAKTLIEGPHHKERIIDMLAQILGIFSRFDYTSITNKTTSYERRFYDVSELISWAKKQSLEKLCEIEFLLCLIKTEKDDLSRYIIFSVEKSSYSNKSAKSKRLKLEIKDYFSDELIFQKNFSDFKKLCDEVHSFIDPSHEKFSPSNPCINVDCRFIVNDCDISDYFLGTQNLNVVCYKTDGTQFIEYTKYTSRGRVTIHHVLAIEENNPLPRTVYSRVCEESTTIRERGFDNGYKWECDVKSLFSKDDLYWKLNTCVNSSDEAGFEELLDEYSDVQPISHFIGIEMTRLNDVYESEIYKFYIKIEHINGKGIKRVVRQKETNYDYYIPTHEKWTYDDFDLV